MILGEKPVLLGIISLLYGVFVLAVCPKKLRHIDIPDGEKTYDGGYYASYNWSITSLIIIPLLVYYFASFSNQLPLAIKCIQDNGLIIARDSGNNADLSLILVSWMKKVDRYGIPIIILITIIINLYDYFSYFNKKDSITGKTVYQDWSVAYQMDHKPVKPWKNLIFNFFAYLNQCFVILFGLLFFYRFFLLVGKIITLISGVSSEYILKINVTDPLEHLGFWPLSGILETYIMIVLLTGFYLVLLRFVHISRGIKWQGGPRLIIVGAITTVIIFLLIPYVLFKTEMDNKLLKAKVGLVSEMRRISLMEESNKQVDLIYQEKLKNDLELVSRQSPLPLKTSTFYFFVTIMVVLIRLVIKPPKSLVDLVYELSGAKSP